MVVELPIPEGAFCSEHVACVLKTILLNQQSLLACGVLRPSDTRCRRRAIARKGRPQRHDRVRKRRFVGLDVEDTAALVDLRRSFVEDVEDKRLLCVWSKSQQAACHVRPGANGPRAKHTRASYRVSKANLACVMGQMWIRAVGSGRNVGPVVQIRRLRVGDAAGAARTPVREPPRGASGPEVGAGVNLSPIPLRVVASRPDVLVAVQGLQFFGIGVVQVKVEFGELQEVRSITLVRFTDC